MLGINCCLFVKIFINTNFIKNISYRLYIYCLENCLIEYIFIILCYIIKFNEKFIYE